MSDLDDELNEQVKALGKPVIRLMIALLDKHHRAIISQLRVEVDVMMAERNELRKALEYLYNETAEYIRINHLGDIHHNHSMQLARDALAGKAASEAAGGKTP